MTKRNSYRYSRLAFFNEASFKKLKRLCGREFSQALRVAEQQNRKWSAEAKSRLEKAMEADEFADIMQKIPRALYADGAIHYNIGKRPHGEESYAIDLKEGMAILLHELKACWQSQDPEWMERHQNKDISIETDAFLKQFEFQKALDLQIPSYSDLMESFDSVSPTEEAFHIKSRLLWEHHNYGCPEYNYKFLNHKPYCIKDSIKLKKENSHENNPLR